MRWLQTYPAEKYSLHIDKLPGLKVWRVIYNGEHIGDFDSFDEALEACKSKGTTHA